MYVVCVCGLYICDEYVVWYVYCMCVYVCVWSVRVCVWCVCMCCVLCVVCMSWGVCVLYVYSMWCVCMSCVVPVPHCLDDYGSIILPEVWEREASCLVFVFAAKETPAGSWN